MPKVVLDIGCAKYGGDESIPYLIEEFEPDYLFGFDPALEQSIGAYLLGATTVVTQRAAAWLFDGGVGFVVAGLGGHVDESGEDFPCFDLARTILSFPDDWEIVLKMDAEGAEYALIPHLYSTDADLRLKLACIEWHCADCGIGGNGRHREGCKGDHAAWEERRTGLVQLMRCEMQEWNR